MADEADTPEVKFPFRRHLKKPIPGKDGDDTSVLELREPTAGDMHDFGVLDGSADGQKMIDMIAKLAEVSKVSVRAMHPKDYFACQRVLTDFFYSSDAVNGRIDEAAR